MPLSRAFGLAALVAVGCGEAAPCAMPGAKQRVAATGNGDRLVSSWAGDHAYYVLQNADGASEAWVGPRCEDDAHPVARGVLLRPVRALPDPLDDDPTLACDGGTGRFFHVDPTGREAPTLAHPGKHCSTRWSEHGLVVRENGYARNKLWLYRRFPAGGTVIAEGAASVRLVGDVVYTNIPDERRIVRYDLAARAGVTITEDLAGTWAASPTHVLWEVGGAAGTTTLRVHELATGEAATIFQDLAGTATQAQRHLWAEGWRFMPDDAHVVFMPPSSDVAPRAFSLDGAPVAFPVPGDLREVHDDRVALSRTTDGQWWATRIGDAAPTRLDIVDPSLADPEADPFFFQRDTPFHAGRAEYVRDGALWAVPFDGGPRRIVAEDVGAAIQWIDADRLLTIVDAALQTVDTRTGERRTHDRDVVDFSAPGDLAAEGAHYLVEAGADDPRTGVWWLPAGDLGP